MTNDDGNALERYIDFLLKHYSVRLILHTLAEACFKRAENTDSSTEVEEWGNMGRTIENVKL